MTILKIALTVGVTLIISTAATVAEPRPQSVESKSQSDDPGSDLAKYDSSSLDERVKIEFIRENGDLFTADVKMDEKLWMKLQDFDIQAAAPAGAETLLVCTCSEEKDLIQKQKTLLGAYEEELDKLKFQIEELEAVLRKKELDRE